MSNELDKEIHDLMIGLLGEGDTPPIDDGVPQLFKVFGIEFQIVAKIKAVRSDGGMADVAGPIIVTKTPDLLEAMFVLSTNCTVSEYMVGDGDIEVAAAQIVNEIRAKKYKFIKPKK